MGENSSDTISVRLPRQVAKELRNLRDHENLASIGAALQVYIQKMKDDRMQRQIDNVAKNLASLVKRDTKRDRILNVTCGAIHYILGAKSPWSKKLRKEMGCKDLQRCFGKNWPGALFKAKVGTGEHIT